MFQIVQLDHQPRRHRPANRLVEPPEDFGEIRLRHKTRQADQQVRQVDDRI